MAILFQIQNLNLAFGEKLIFKDAKLSVHKGDRIGLIGLNGHGKSTLFKIIMGEVSPDVSNPPFLFDTNNEEFSVLCIPQELDIQGHLDLDITHFYLSLYPKLKSLHQELKALEDEMVHNATEEILNRQQNLLDQIDHLKGWQIQQSYLSYLKTFDLNDLDKNLTNLSGGEQRKMALAMGLSAPSSLILWDEPTNHLDTKTIELFEEELKKSQKTYMIISHDRYLLNETTNKILHIERGSLESFDGSYLDYLEYQEEKEKELAKNLDKLENKHRRELGWMRQGIKARGTRSKKRVEGFNNLQQDIKKLKENSKKRLNLNLEHSGNKSKLLLEINDGAFSHDDKPLLKDLNLSLYKGNKVALLGPNGAGKSTLIKIIEGKYNLDSGRFHQPKEIKTVVFDQKRESLDLSKSLFEIIGDGKDHVHLPSGKLEHVNSYLQKFLFTKDQINRPCEGLSGGEKNRLQLAMFMQQSADLWVFDEPTNDLDIESIEMLEQTLIEYSQPVIIISHDRSFLDKVCQVSWLIEDNSITVFNGGYTQVADYIFEKELIESLEPKTTTEEKTETSIIETSTEVSAPKPRMNYNEKKRWKSIEDEIAEQEETVENMKEEMAAFDFTQENSHQIFQDLEMKFNKESSKLDNLYAEWEDLSEKSPD